MTRAGRSTSRCGLDYLELHELGVEDSAELGKQFDHIVCTGVTHHLADPDAGLAALVHPLSHRLRTTRDFADVSS